METHGYIYAESGGSSPRSSRDHDVEPPLSSEDQPPPPVPANHKVKFMVSYGGKIQPRHHDNTLSYVGGHTKIIYVDRSISFSSLISKLSSIMDDDSSTNSLSSFKYQLPGEDLDALISVSNDDDLMHLMHEYDRLYRASPKPVRLRLFLFPQAQSSRFGSGSSDPDPAADSVAGIGVITNKVDFLFGLDNKVLQPERVTGSDPLIEAQIQELNRLQISTSKTEAAGETYRKVTLPPPTTPTTVQAPATYWQPPTVTEPAVRVEQHRQQPPPSPPPQQQPVYVVHAPPPASAYHTPAVRPSTTQGYYPVYTVAGAAPPSFPPAPVTQPAPVKVARYSQEVGVPVRAPAVTAEARGRQVYYGAPPRGVGVVMAAFQGSPAPAVVVSGDMRAAGGLTNYNVDGKIVSKVSRTSAAV